MSSCIFICRNQQTFASVAGVSSIRSGSTLPEDLHAMPGVSVFGAVRRAVRRKEPEGPKLEKKTL